MRVPMLCLAAAVAALPAVSAAQGVRTVVTPDQIPADATPFEVAVLLGVCGDRDVVDARWVEEDLIGYRCADEVTAFVPLIGGLAPLLGAAAAAAAVAAAGDAGSSTSDTQ